MSLPQALIFAATSVPCSLQPPVLLFLLLQGTAPVQLLMLETARCSSHPNALDAGPAKCTLYPMLCTSSQDTAPGFPEQLFLPLSPAYAQFWDTAARQELNS